jgi:hypothetical protein
MTAVMRSALPWLLSSFAVGALAMACSGAGGPSAGGAPASSDGGARGDTPASSADAAAPPGADGGTTPPGPGGPPAWEVVGTGYYCTFATVWGSGPSDVWVGGKTPSGNNGCILHWDGKALTDVYDAITRDAPAFGEPVTKIWGRSATDAWFLSRTAAHWDGASLHVFDPRTGPRQGTAFTLGGDPSSGIVFASGVFAHYVWKWNGTGWSDEPIDSNVAAINFRTIFGVGGNVFWGGGDLGHLASYSPGTGWVEEDLTMSNVNSMNFTDLWGSGPNDVWAVAATPSDECLAHYNGKSWTRVYTHDAALILNGISGTSPSDIWAVGSAVWHYDGAVWSKQIAPAATDLAAVWAAGSNDVWTVARSGKVFHLH